jgi:predicted transcriptional regulator
VTPPDDAQLEQYLGSLELRIMKAVWRRGPSTVNDVLDELNDGRRRSLVYNTVMSTMGRLADKGYLDRHRDGKAYVYEGDGPEAFLRDRVAATVRDAYEQFGDLALAGFTDGLDEDGRDELRRLLDAEDEPET